MTLSAAAGGMPCCGPRGIVLRRRAVWLE